MAYSANTLITPTMVAKEALAILRNNCVYKDLVHTDFSEEFVNHIGDTVNVRVPATQKPMILQPILQPKIQLKHTFLLHLTSSRTFQSLSHLRNGLYHFVDFSRQVIAPAMAAIGEAVDKDIANAIFGGAGSTVSRTAATPSTLGDFASVAKALDIAKAPKINRSLVMSPYHKYVYAQLDHLVKGSYAGSNDLLRRNEIGPVYGIDTSWTKTAPTSLHNHLYCRRYQYLASSFVTCIIGCVLTA